MQNNIFAQKINSLSKFSKVLGKMPQMPGGRMQSVQKPQDAEDTANELYDVDRWREAERQAEWDRDIMGTSGSNIEQVRRKWNKASDADDDDADDIYGSSAARDSASERRSERDVRVNSVYARINRQDVGPVTDAGFIFCYCIVIYTFIFLDESNQSVYYIINMRLYKV